MPIVLPLVDLSALLILVVCLGVLYALTYFCKAFFGIAGSTLGKLPVLGGWLNSGIHSIEKRVSGYMADAVDGVETAVGATWHVLARVVDWTGHEIASHAVQLYTMATVTLGHEWASAIRHAHALFVASANELTKLVHAQVARIAAAEERLRHGIGADVLPRIRAQERAWERVIGKELPAIRAREHDLEHGAADVWKWIRSHPQALASGAFAGAVAWSLSRLGAAWIRCTRVNRLGRSVCAMDEGLLESLLADALILAGSISIVELARECQAITGPAETALKRFVREL